VGGKSLDPSEGRREIVNRKKGIRRKKGGQDFSYPYLISRVPQILEVDWSRKGQSLASLYPDGRVQHYLLLKIRGKEGIEV